MFIPGQYSTLGRVGSVNSMLRRSDTRDSGCQTEETKVVPPSMRRIRAQRGQGIAAQMAGISTSSSTGSISVSSSDGSGILRLPQFNRNPSRFHSLPRQGARVSLSADPLYSSTPIKSEERAPPPRQIGKLQVDDTAVHMRNAPRTGALPRPKSQEFRGTLASDWGGGPACVVSPHASYSTSLIPNATLSCSSEVITLNTYAQLPYSQASAYPAARPPGHASPPNSDPRFSRPTGITHSFTCPSLATSTPTRTPKDGGPEAAKPASESGLSDSSVHSRSTSAPTPPPGLPEEQWIYDTPENVALPHRALTSSCSIPMNQMYSSLERSSRTTTDSSSLYSQDNDGYYTSMHVDSGLRSRSHGSGQSAAPGRAARHSMYECREMAQQEDSAKKPPLPPARTDSLRRKPSGKKPLGGVGAVGGAREPDGAVLNETLIASLQQSLQLGLTGGKGKGASPSSPSHSPSSDYDDPWVLRPRSQSSVSAGSSAASLGANAHCGGGAASVYSLCHVTPAQSDTSSLRSEYADSWGYYMDYPRNHCDQRAQTPPAHAAESMPAGAHPGESRDGGEMLNGGRAPGAPGQEGGVAAKPKIAASSPDRVHRLTSPSSGYSSQSNTPTAGTPVPSFVRSMSPSGSRPKPRAKKGAPTPALSNGPTKAPKPLITPSALQGVQLRAVKQPEREINGKQDRTKAPLLKPQTLERSFSLEQPAVVHLSNCSPEEDPRSSSPSPVSKLLEELFSDCRIKEDAPAFISQPIDEQVPSPQEETTNVSHAEDQVDAPQRQIQTEKKDDQSEQRDEEEEEEEEETPESSALPSESGETSTVAQNESHCSASDGRSRLDLGLYTNGEAQEEDEDEDEGDGTSSTTGSISSKEDDTGESDLHILLSSHQIKVMQRTHILNASP
ncbi:NHS-like protein 1 [Liparis tanakae]|uniref:NHS-like protein 1 n=1 Tax=Liparis tanakae TaxID=230148 RepID=A0A4Z2HUJ1_9TELE|nr:NHS-like protein 1 [Liparis tanakae]